MTAHTSSHQLAVTCAEPDCEVAARFADFALSQPSVLGSSRFRDAVQAVFDAPGEWGPAQGYYALAQPDERLRPPPPVDYDLIDTAREGSDSRYVAQPDERLREALMMYHRDHGPDRSCCSFVRYLADATPEHVAEIGRAALAAARPAPTGGDVDHFVGMLRSALEKGP